MVGWVKKRLWLKASMPGLVITAIVAGFAYGLMEWLFMVTKPSFMDALTISRKLQILAFSGSLLSALILIGLLPAIMLYRLIRGKNRDAAALLIHFLYLVPSGVIACVLLLWLDNFTYTVFQFGIVSSEGLGRAAYALVFLAFIGMSYYFIRSLASGYERIPGRSRVKTYLPYGLVLAMVLVLIFPFMSGGTNSAALAATTTKSGALPNIFIITSDGVNANNMSVYGYERDTTPQLRELAKTSLVAENAFTNSGNTSGSVISIYTGKYPSKTRVMYPPDILRGPDSYQHLPGILRSLGYRTIQISYPHFVDAYTLNLLNGFDMANLRTLESVYFKTLNTYLPHDFAYFFYDTSNRIFDRLRHIFFVKKMVNPFNLLKIPSERYSELEKLHQLLHEIRSTTQPLFVHIHFMGTHGARFFPDEQVFSQGLESERQEEWNVDFYDDGILEFDGYVGQIVAELRDQNQFENSILVIGSDHGQQFTTHDRIPLIIRFPEGQFAGRVGSNAQNIDIAPTILDYLEIPLPEWIDGDSLLQAELKQRPIIAFLTHKYSDGRLVDEQVRPPFYQFDTVSAIHCNRWYRVNLETFEMESGEVAGFHGTCPQEESLSEAEVIGLIGDHLAANGFDTAELEDRLQPVAAGQERLP